MFGNDNSTLISTLKYNLLFINGFNFQLNCFYPPTQGSRITFQATPSNIYPVLTKTLQLRCGVQQTGMVVKKQIEAPLLLQPTKSSGTTSWLTTPTTAATSGPSIHAPQTNIPKAAQVGLSHIISIIVSRSDKTTGLQEKVASLSSFDPPTAYVDLDKITVDGYSDSSSIAGELGYLEITWAYPVTHQAGNYTCEVYAMDITLRPVSTSEAVHITASEPTISELASIIAQNSNYITELSQTVSELRNQTSHLQTQSQENALAMKNISQVIHRNETNSLIIQTGPITCPYYDYGTHVWFERPYNNIPTVFVTLNGLAINSYPGSVNVTIYDLTETSFYTRCDYNNYYNRNNLVPTADWIAIGS